MQPVRRPRARHRGGHNRRNPTVSAEGGDAAAGSVDVESPRMRCAGKDALSLALIDARNHSLRWMTAFDRALPASALGAAPPAGSTRRCGSSATSAGSRTRWIARNLQRARGTGCDPAQARLASVLAQADALYDPDAVPSRGAGGLALPTCRRHASTSSTPSRRRSNCSPPPTRATTRCTSSASRCFTRTRSPTRWPSCRRRWASTPGSRSRPARRRATRCSSIDRASARVRARRLRLRQREMGARGRDPGVRDRCPGGELGPVRRVRRGRRLRRSALLDPGAGTGCSAPVAAARVTSSKCATACSRSASGKAHPRSARAAAMHLTWYEADAWCRWANRRLPTEVEWEHAAIAGRRAACAGARSASGRRARFGRTAPGFAPDPWRAYSEPAFGRCKGAARGLVRDPRPAARPARAPFLEPERDEGFYGFRSCAA